MSKFKRKQYNKYNINTYRPNTHIVSRGGPSLRYGRKVVGIGIGIIV